MIDAVVSSWISAGTRAALLHRPPLWLGHSSDEVRSSAARAPVPRTWSGSLWIEAAVT